MERCMILNFLVATSEVSTVGSKGLRPHWQSVLSSFKLGNNRKVLQFRDIENELWIQLIQFPQGC